MALDGQRVLVVGGSSGMGLATARAAADEGAEVVIASSRADRIDAALAGLPAGTRGVVLDLRDRDRIPEVVGGVGELDHVVFTAGDSLDRSSLVDQTMDQARAGFDVRFWGAVAVIAAATPHLRPGASITLTTGTIGQRPRPGAALAAASVGATEGLVRGLAVELAPVRVNAVRAGAFRTPLWDGVPEAQRDALFARLAQGTLTGTVGEPEWIAATHLLLMQNPYITGTVITVDGGALLA